MSKLKDLRTEKQITQKQAAELVGISLRSYKDYENNPAKESGLKYNFIIEKLSEYKAIDETHGILTLEYIKDKCSSVLKQYTINYCILFGSYAKTQATENSDVDLLISGDISGLKFYGLVEELRSILKKRVDVLDLSQLKNNIELTDEILKSGIRIYG